MSGVSPVETTLYVILAHVIDISKRLLLLFDGLKDLLIVLDQIVPHHFTPVALLLSM